MNLKKKKAQLENYFVYLTTWERVLSCFRMFLEKLGKANRHIENETNDKNEVVISGWRERLFRKGNAIREYSLSQ